MLSFLTLYCKFLYLLYKKWDHPTSTTASPRLYKGIRVNKIITNLSKRHHEVYLIRGKFQPRIGSARDTITRRLRSRADGGSSEVRSATTCAESSKIAPHLLQELNERCRAFGDFRYFNSFSFHLPPKFAISLTFFGFRK